jgi:iron complex transport system substrate-binding protein
MEDVMKTIRTAVLALVLAACSGGAATTTTAEPESTTTSTAVVAEATFPVTVTGTNGDVTIDTEPQAIVSLSPSGTEVLFAIGAGDQVTAVDEYSYYPSEAPVTDLSGFTPNVEAIAAYEPDLVLVSDDIDGVIGSLEGLGIPVLQLSGGDVATLDDLYGQIEVLGMATGHPAEALQVVADMKDMVDKALALAPDSASGLSYYHELDPTYYTVTSSTFIGYLYGLFGLENIADAADADGSSFGYPQLSEEYILEADPDFVFVTDCCGDTPQTVAKRAGWDGLTAVRSSSIVVFDDDISSRWGPRIVEFVRGIAQAIEEKNPT